MPRSVATLILLVATMVWGLGFIAQKFAMADMGPLTFIAARYLLGGLVILPLALWEHGRNDTPITPKSWRLIAVVTMAFFFGSWLQQAGLVTTTLTNGGFLTGLYVLFVPLILLVFFRVPPHAIVWVCMLMALVGLYALNGARLDRIAVGDALVAGGAVFWAIHVLALGAVARATGRPIFVSAITFLASGVIALGAAFMLEPVSIDGLVAGWPSIVYAGVVSTAIGFTLQAIGQRHVPPANAAIILSGEALFAALGGAIVFGERLNGLGYIGIGLLLAAIVLVEFVPAFTHAKRKSAG